MRRDVQDIFRMTPHEKQVMMFSATLSKEIRPICKKFMQDVNIPHRGPLDSSLELGVGRHLFSQPDYGYRLQCG